MPFLTEPEPERGTVQPVLPGISRIVAPNPGPMTYFGTNTYLIDTVDGLVVLDPGPEEHPEHVEAILRATAPNVALILVSHTHHDHVGAVPALQEATGAPTVGFRDSGSDSFAADIKLADGDVIAGMVAIHTPGHASDHLCFALPAKDGTAVLFSADHVMSWSTSVPAWSWSQAAEAARTGARNADAPHGARAGGCCRADQRGRRHLHADGHAVFTGASAAASRRRTQRAGASAEARGRGEGAARRGVVARGVIPNLE
jgi:glyoxylase-like metal-dependent hydrolase (beta-lactamase superfamily II)